ncbi:MAG: hypothetical protein JW733_08400, partial [Coriobacteriia bacterium]|nr:hypothetical protein [Coriobacteriia bacterium]MBN2847346.1 hypothetical protein [Coriobacteriia bacterium]
CNAIIVDQRGVRTRWLDSAEFEHPLSLGLLRLIRHNAIFVQCAVRATAMREVGGFDARLRACEDYDLWLRLLAAGHRHLYTPECLGLYHRTPTSLSSHYQREAQHVALVLQSLIDTGTLSTAEERAARMRIRAALARMELERRRAENDLRISRRDALATAAAYGTPTRRAVARVLALVSPGTYLKIAFRRRGEQVDALYEGTRDVDERTSDQAL